MRVKARIRIRVRILVRDRVMIRDKSRVSVMPHHVTLKDDANRTEG